MGNIIAAIPFIGLLLLTALCSYNSPSDSSYRMRMTVAIETPEGIKTGTTVHEMSVKYGAFKSSGSYFEGESVVVDLGDRGVLFTLLEPRNPGREEAARLVNEENGKFVLKPEEYPEMVYYKTMKTPLVMEVAHTTGTKIRREMSDFGNGWQDFYTHFPIDHMEESFGKGVAIKEVVIESTKDPVTRGIVRKYLPSSMDKSGSGLFLRESKKDHEVTLETVEDRVTTSVEKYFEYHGVKQPPQDVNTSEETPLLLKQFAIKQQ